MIGSLGCFHFVVVLSPLGLAEWHAPNAGLFLWIKIKGVSDTFQMVMEKALEKGVRKIDYSTAVVMGKAKIFHDVELVGEVLQVSGLMSLGCHV